MRRVLWASILVTVICVFTVAQGPRFIHLSWQHDPATTITIMWRTDPSVTETVVEYGLTPEYGRTATGTRISYTALRQEIVWHVVELTDLAPNTTYHYRCGAPGYWSADYTFTTAPASDDTVSQFTFAVIGDTQGGYKVMKQIFATLKERGVRFILMTGDFTDGAGQMEFDMWFEAAGDVLAYIPFMPCHGNHEMLRNTYFDQFALPGNEKWFSYDYGPIHFVHLFSQNEEYALQQRGWLLKDLRSTARPWKIALAHHPAYNSGTQHGCTSYVLDHWVDIFERCILDIYFAGHEHIYERTWPIRQNRIDGDGVVYVITGSAGAQYREPGKAWWTAVSDTGYCYILVDVTWSRLTITAYNLDGKIIDKFALYKR
jgi:hypothetical protein